MHTACVVHLWLTSCSWIKATSIISQRFEGECMLTHNSLKGGAFAVAASPNCYCARAALPQHSISSQRTPYNRVMQLSWRVLDETSTMHKSLRKGICLCSRWPTITWLFDASPNARTAATIPIAALRNANGRRLSFANLRTLALQ